MTIHAPTPTARAVRLEAVSKVYGSGGSAVRAIDNVSVSVLGGAFTAVMGPSGWGKSTFLQCAAGLDRPTSGRVWLGGIELSGKKEKALAEFRREHVGFVFQSYNLLGWLTVEQNITLPLQLSGRRADPGLLREVTAAVELDVRMDQRPSELSGGQQQRVALARALVTRPKAMFLDALRRVAGGGTAIDPEVVAQLLVRSRPDARMERLSARERDVLALMAEGLGNGAVAERLVVTEGAVHKHIRSIFAKLDLAPADPVDRRVAAVLHYLKVTKSGV